MRLDGAGPVLTAAAAVVSTAVLLALIWDAGSGGRRILLRAGVVTACLASVLASAALELDQLTDTYPTWTALVGADKPASHEPTAAEPAGARFRGGAVPIRRHPQAVAGRTGRGTVVGITIAGRAAGITMPAFVYLPAAYGESSARHTQFPVIEALHGYPGSPKTWLRRLDVRDHLDREITAGRMAPTVVVFPYQTPRVLLDTECTNLAGGPQAETYLIKDVPATVRARFRVRTDRAGWALIGYSAGGFCATNLALRHPGEYVAAASLSGYAQAGIAIGDGSEHTTNDQAWRLRHLPQPAIGLYLAYANDDRHARRDNLLLARLAHSPLIARTALVAHGGHSDAVWQQMEGPAFDWLSSWLARPAI
jgi:enterochelin esterase-like enzyme